MPSAVMQERAPNNSIQLTALRAAADAGRWVDKGTVIMASSSSRCGVCAAQLLFALMAVTPVRASFEFPLEVAQPLATEQGIFISRVSYVKYLGSTTPGYDASLVGQASCVVDDQGKSVNRNVASLLGIKTWYDPLHEGGHLIGDTLRVYIDLSSVGSAPPSANWTVSDALAATVECVLTAASNSRTGWDPKNQRRVDAKYVDLRVKGPPEYKGWGGVYSFESLGSLPRRRVFK